MSPIPILLGWLTLLWLGAQLPQLTGPIPHTDGLSRADWVSAVGLGLHAIAGSLPAWLLGLGAIVWFSLHTFGRRDPAQLATLERALRQIPASQGHLRLQLNRWWGRPRLEDQRRVRARWLLIAAVFCGLLGVLWQGAQPASRWFEVAADGSVRAQDWDAGRLRASETVRGRCEPSADALNCSWQRDGKQEEFVVNRQQAATIADGRIHWLGSGAAPGLARATVRWRGDGAENAPWYVFPLRAGRSVRVDSLQRRLTLIEGGLSGPVIVSEHAGKATIALTSGLLDGERNVRLISRDRHLLRLDPNTPMRWLWLLCAALLFGGAAFAAASNRAEVVVVDGLVEVHGLEANDDALRLALEEAGS